jgi:ATP-binding cassette subfamily F protein uup
VPSQRDQIGGRAPTGIARLVVPIVIGVSEIARGNLQSFRESAMATLLQCDAVSKHFGVTELFNDLSISFAEGERVGFLGPNGAGKTTFLRILAEQVQPDTGTMSKKRGARIGYLAQEDLFEPGDTVLTAVSAVVDDQQLEVHQRDTQVLTILTRFGFEKPDQPVSELSGGWKKRLAIARQFVRDPDLLLLDEPTNHLDLANIEWLENTLLNVPFAIIAVSHDRYFLERVSTRVVELNPVYPEGYFSVAGSYSAFLEKRADLIESQKAQAVTLANIVRREAAFLKSHAKARRTKSKSRIDEAYRLHDELQELTQRNAQGRAAGINFDATGRRSSKLVELKGIAKTLGTQRLFQDVYYILSPGTRLGILGANGSGKTTLLRVLTKDLAPDEGSVQHAENLRIVVFDQKREELPQDQSLHVALAGTHNSVDFRGRSVHITAWAKRFLFRIDQLDMPVGQLSGGEQARILIARLMLRPADVLILDEPTNDLDINSLEVLEQSLVEFPGAVVLVTHDRYMLDRVSTEIIGLGGNGQVARYMDCAQWQAAMKEQQSREKAPNAKTAKAKRRSDRKPLTASEERELRDIESTILEAEEDIAACEKATHDPEISGDHVEAQKRWEALEAARKAADEVYARWEFLEAKSKGKPAE